MTSLRPVPSVSVARALTDVAGLGSFFSLTTGDADGEWRPVSDAYAAGLGHLVSARAARYGTPEPRIAASIVQLGHAARLWSPILGCVIVHGVIPDLGGLQQRVDGPELRLPAPRGWEAPRDGTLTQVLYRLVMEDHLAPLSAGLRVKVAPRLLHGNAASALAEAARDLLRAWPELGPSITRLATDLLRTRKLRGLGEFTGPRLEFRRRSCCLNYRVPEGRKCGDCSLDRKAPGHSI
ncbi:(2Fe-2S)-binding protein [Sphaerisporangium sp. NBC_01403]|uniref:(2Fe-2S)-binding protein n=1 Tax=Sphaerisporangium sp. NBC_01403 TaxID=2903599 RepID=UPI0032527452